ncbi:hypothetical protein C7M84_012238 [Penaeus vannamei]|uniref:Uncharacterized protein n=1 Tax=Penaeus vannamei TaxID=6689 RepID=A0A3R7NXL3_PENVA|nr:hypothetical protein C7M84_012238 [Penaeus vannamei]
MRTLLLSLLVGCAFGASVERPRRQVFGARINLESSYLPPKEEATASHLSFTARRFSSIPPSSSHQPSTRQTFSTSHKHPSAHSKSSPPYTHRSSALSRFLQCDTKRSLSLALSENLRTQVVTLPPQVNYVTSTQQSVRTQVQYQTRYETRIQQVGTSAGGQHRLQNTDGYKDTAVARSDSYCTHYSVQHSLFYCSHTCTERRQDYPACQDQRRHTNHHTPGQTRVITSTQLVPVTTTVISQVVRTNTQIQYVTRTQVEQRVSTVVRTQQVPQYNTRIVTVPQQVVRTQVSTRVVPTTIYAQRTASSYINLPAQTRYVTVTQTSVRTQQLAGQTRTQYNTRIVYNTNYVTSTVYREQYNTVTATQTVKGDCGYSYSAPARAFNPFSG